MFHFTGCCSAAPMYSGRSHPILIGWGYPIRKSPDHSVFAAPRSLSQLITSFIACWHQGIHHVLLVACSILRLKNLNYLIKDGRPRGTDHPANSAFEVALFCPICGCQRTLRNIAFRTGLSELVFPMRQSGKFKTRCNQNGGPDRTRTYDPALIKRML